MAQGRSAVPRLQSPLGRVLSASVIVLVGVMAQGSPAHAGDLPRVLVLPYAPIYDGLPVSSGEKAAEVLQNELRSSEQLQLLTAKIEKTAAVAPKPSPGPARDTAALTEARERALKAEDLTKKLKFREAANELEKVISLFEAQHPYIDFNDLVEAYLNVAVAYFRLGMDTEGEKALSQVVRLDPERKLDAERYPPVFIRAFENMGRKVKKAPRATIEVKPTAAGVPVVLDGREVGRAPLIIKDVLKGTHYLRVGSHWANRIEAQGGELKVAPDIGSGGGPVAELVTLLARNVIDETVVTKALALASAGSTAADYVVLGGVHKESDAIVVSSHLLKVATRKVCLLQRVVFDSEMLGAGIEIYKVGTDITNKIEVFGDEEPLPAKVARDALAPAGHKPLVAVSASSGEPAPVERIVRRNPDQPNKVEKIEKPADAPLVAKVEKPADPGPTRTEVRKVSATEPGMIPLEPVGPGEEATSSSSSKAWIWVVVGIVVAAGVGTLVGFEVDAASKPITGKGTITW